MQSKATRYAVNGFIVLLILAFVGGLFYWIWWGRTRLPVVDKAPAWKMQNINGQYESSEVLAGRVRLVEFIYVHCPDICPATTYKMVSLQEQLKKQKLFGKDVAFASISFDPERDTPEVLKSYGDGLKVDWSGWTFYRGTQAETDQVLSGFKIFAEKQPDGTFIHPTQALFLIDRNDNIRKIYGMGDKMDNAEIMKDMLQLVKEK